MDRQDHLVAPDWKDLETIFWIAALIEHAIPSPAWFPQVIHHVKDRSAFDYVHQVSHRLKENGNLFAKLDGISETVVYQGIEAGGYISLDDCRDMVMSKAYKPFSWLFGGVDKVPDLKSLGQAKNRFDRARQTQTFSVTDHSCIDSFCEISPKGEIVGIHNPPKVWFHRGCAMAHQKAEHALKERAYRFFCPCCDGNGIYQAQLGSNGHVVTQKSAPAKKFAIGRPPVGIYTICDDPNVATYIKHPNQVVLDHRREGGSGKAIVEGQVKDGLGISSNDPYGVFMMSYLRAHGDLARSRIATYMRRRDRDDVVRPLEPVNQWNPPPGMLQVGDNKRQFGQ